MVETILKYKVKVTDCCPLPYLHVRPASTSSHFNPYHPQKRGTNILLNSSLVEGGHAEIDVDSRKIDWKTRRKLMAPCDVDVQQTFTA